MTSRALASAWALAIGVLMVAAAALAASAFSIPPVFGGAQIAVIGSSQSKYAFAKHAGRDTEDGTSSSLLGDGRSHFRIGLPAISEAEAVALVEQAAAERAELILLEVWPFIYELPSLHAARRCDQPARRLRVWLKERQHQQTDVVARLIGRATSTDDGGEPPDIDRRTPEHFAATARSYGLVMRGPCDMDRLARAVRGAQSGGSRIILVAPPRSTTAERLLGADQVQALDNAARDLARRLAVPLFAPEGPWPDDLFISIGHLSGSGRAQLQSRLRDWSDRRP
ncbi:hypothetical protein [Alteraurantiacibacter buctensis]|uniref:SGNH/GDSL hydrolase family protein n=1 Tax=Alteraurantiacibacter buctensis TaxID=1503981 RepID=A0A844YYM0_9SPHN|nr:hypothetical protein [Alteraurantiacibacter buctensis]MXO71881.1 hypothetical protein [Alteraurantiacibacter buctensis]